jgi:hypothetical protein
MKEASNQETVARPFAGERGERVKSFVVDYRCKTLTLAVLPKPPGAFSLAMLKPEKPSFATTSTRRSVLKNSARRSVTSLYSSQLLCDRMAFARA